MPPRDTRVKLQAFNDFDAETRVNIVRHFQSRYATHTQLLYLLDAGMDEEYVDLALGITDGVGNYSASDHKVHLGHKILSRTGWPEVAAFARESLMSRPCRELPRLVLTQDMPWLKTSVGSEMMCLLRPDSCWVTNKRTVYTYFLHQNNDDWEKAIEAVQEMTRGSEDVSDTYDAWSEIHPEIVYALLELAEAGRHEFASELRAAGASSIAGSSKFLWADAVASQVYDWSEWE